MAKFTIDKALLVEMARTRTFKEIAEHFQVGPVTITRIAKGHGIVSNSEKGRARPGEVEQVFELASQGLSHRAIGKILRRSDSFVFYHLHKWTGEKTGSNGHPRTSARLDAPDRAQEKRLEAYRFEDAPQRLLDKECRGTPIIGARASAHCREIAISSSAQLCADAG